MPSLRTTLRKSINELNIRGLRLSSKFLSEQLLGLDDGYIDEDDDDDFMNKMDVDEETLKELDKIFTCHIIKSRDNDIIQFALSLIHNGEYQRAAHWLRKNNNHNTINNHNTSNNKYK